MTVLSNVAGWRRRRRRSDRSRSRYQTNNFHKTGCQNVLLSLRAGGRHCVARAEVSPWSQPVRGETQHQANLSANLRAVLGAVWREYAVVMKQAGPPGVFDAAV